MSHRALASFLDDFSGGREPSPSRFDKRLDATELACVKARADALEEARAEQERLLAEWQARYEDDLRRAREAWTREETARLEEALAQVSSDVTARVCLLVSECLRPFLERSARDAALTAFAAQVSDLLKLGNALRLRVSGAPDLLSALRERLGPAADHCDFVESERAGLEASLAGSVVTSRLDEWLGAIAPNETKHVG